MVLAISTPWSQPRPSTALILASDNSLNLLVKALREPLAIESPIMVIFLPFSAVADPLATETPLPEYWSKNCLAASRRVLVP